MKKGNGKKSPSGDFRYLIDVLLRIHRYLIYLSWKASTRRLYGSAFSCTALASVCEILFLLSSFIIRCRQIFVNETVTLKEGRPITVFSLPNSLFNCDFYFLCNFSGFYGNGYFTFFDTPDLTRTGHGCNLLIRRCKGNLFITVCRFSLCL